MSVAKNLMCTLVLSTTFYGKSIQSDTQAVQTVMENNMDTRSEPVIIQGGMGVAVSGWRLANAVSRTGQLGVVSGTAMETVLIRRLQLGDPGAHMRRAIDEFPFQDMADRILDRYFIPGGKQPSSPFATTRMPSASLSRQQQELIAIANFVEVFLAKEDHNGPVGINYLEKIQVPTLPALYGAMLAGVDYVLMGAGIPKHIPEILDRLSEGESVSLQLNIDGVDDGDECSVHFDPVEFTNGEVPWLCRPKFLAIVASSTLATMLARKSSGRVDGFIVEGPTAGGHNAPPRGKMQIDARGEPVYGRRDSVDMEAMRSLGIPFWLAGSYGLPERVADALRVGASGVQIGTAFAFCEESGLRDDIKRQVIRQIRDDQIDVFTDPKASPARFPFKVLRLEETLSDPSIYQARQRRCDLGFLRQGFRKKDGTIGWRCPAENVETFVQKGGVRSEAIGRKCLCNGLLANVGLEQVRGDGTREKPLLTCGDDVRSIVRFLETDDSTSYSASDVVGCMLSALTKA